MQIAGRNFLVTGAASGMGLATAQTLLAAGANVTLVDQNPTLNQIVEGLGARALAFKADVSSESDMRAAVDLAAQGGELHGVVHCAGIADLDRLVDDDGQPASLDRYRRVLDINLVGTFNVMRLAAALMRKNLPQGADGERGVIINVSSIAAYDGTVGTCGYAASKGGVIAMTLPAARELGDYGIRVMSIAPGTFGTPMLAGMVADRVQASAQATPFPRRLGQAEDFALLAEQVIVNVMFNGADIRLDGGLRLRH
ncbi:SDR family NAD(P)-dependent oxidoreductase [Pseudomonas sp. PDM31]|uniref:SDR family NAD(P)-dependent oxidoreductase n=1 Tax=Pseudomonas sp. PDM31 TaxID=2854778 RepID=UPI001C441A33|nr:SDR family NAD(P)-dependent oxidoreductase [Pseudomonas sp. PDM31]MBV7477638.1 SDR family NAD(P)-dependent oxidoreductase [Pseudomonas sp. PDM31]